MIKLITVLLACMLMQALWPARRPAIKYIPLGDSYTICTGTPDASESWPALLAAHLAKTGTDVQIVCNPARNGYSTQDLIDQELPLLDEKGADFVTLLIGVNDWVRQVDINTFHQNLHKIIDHVQQKLSNPAHLVLITIPDFGVTPQGAVYSHGRDISKGLSAFNDVIKAEAKKRRLACVDIFPASQSMKNDATLVAADGLHPSAKEYAVWESLIFPVAGKVLSGK